MCNVAMCTCVRILCACVRVDVCCMCTTLPPERMNKSPVGREGQKNSFTKTVDGKNKNKRIILFFFLKTRATTEFLSRHDAGKRSTVHEQEWAYLKKKKKKKYKNITQGGDWLWWWTGGNYCGFWSACVLYWCALMTYFFFYKVFCPPPKKKQPDECCCVKNQGKTWKWQ